MQSGRPCADAAALPAPRALPPPGSWVDIRYHRIERPTETYRQLVLESGNAGIVTFQSRTPIGAPLQIGGTPILEPGSPVVWFTFPGAWHDIGLFHLADGTPTGLYANALTPVEFAGPATWETTDLCLDVWIPADGPARLLDEADLEQAEKTGLIQHQLARRAREESVALLRGHRAGTWPPALVQEWSLARALAQMPER